MYYTNNGTNLYQGDIINGDREATQSEINAYLSTISILDKWASVENGRSSLTVTTIAGNKYTANRESIMNMTSKINILINGITIKWVEDWGSWIVDSVELAEARDLAEKADQALIDSIFI